MSSSLAGEEGYGADGASSLEACVVAAGPGAVVAGGAVWFAVVVLECVVGCSAVVAQCDIGAHGLLYSCWLLLRVALVAGVMA